MKNTNSVSDQIITKQMMNRYQKMVNAGVGTLDDIKREYQLILKKESKLPRILRRDVVLIYQRHQQDLKPNSINN